MNARRRGFVAMRTHGSQSVGLPTNGRCDAGPFHARPVARNLRMRSPRSGRADDSAQVGQLRFDGSWNRAAAQRTPGKVQPWGRFGFVLVQVGATLGRVRREFSDGKLLLNPTAGERGSGGAGPGGRDGLPGLWSTRATRRNTNAEAHGAAVAPGSRQQTGLFVLQLVALRGGVFPSGG